MSNLRMKFVFNTSNSGDLDISGGFSLFFNGVRNLPLAFESSWTLFDIRKRSWAVDFDVICRITWYFGWAPPGYAINSYVLAEFSNSDNDATFEWGGTVGNADNRDGVSAGAKFDIVFRISIKIFLDIGPEFTLEFQANFSVVDFILDLIFDGLNEGRGKGKVRRSGGINFYDEGIGSISSSGESRVVPNMQVKFNLVNKFAWSRILNKKLEKFGGGFAVGIAVKLGFPVTVQPTHIFARGKQYVLSKPDNNVVTVTGASNHSMGANWPYMRIRHDVGITVIVGPYAEASVWKFFSVGKEIGFDIGKFLGWRGGGNFQADLRATERYTLAQAPNPQPTHLEKPRVIFHKPSTT
jgi:hypothetical protein